MTACVNKHTKRVAAVVTASLVGALSLGVAPVAAMATEGIETLADETGSIARGEVEYAHNYKDGQKFTFTGEAQGLTPTVLKDENESGAFSHDLKLCTKTNGRYAPGYYYFYVDLNETDNVTALFGGKDVYYMDGTRKVPVSGKIVADSADNCMPSAVGKYAVVVGHFNGTSWDAIVSQTATFTISARSLDDAALFQGGDPADTTINYTGENGCDYVENVIADMGVTVDDGRVLDPDEDYDIEIWDDGARAEIADGNTLVPGTEYIAKIKGIRAYSGEEKDVRFTYEKLDLSAAAIVGAVVVDSGAGANRPDDTYVFDDIVASVDGIEVDASNTEISSYVTDAAYSYKFISSPDDDQTSNDNGKGVYTYEISAAETDPYVKGTATVQVMFVDREAAIDFGNGYLDQDGDKVFQVDLNADDVIPFTTSGIKVTYTDEGHKTKQLAPSQYKITDLEGNVLTDADFTTPGTRYVKVYVEQWVTANDGHTQHLVGGYDIAKVVTSYTVTEAADVFFSFDGKNVESAVDAEYTGSNMAERMAFKVYAGDKVLEQGTDYKVVFEAEDAERKRTEVDEIVDAGIYYVTVEGISYSGTAEFTLTVTPMEITSAAPVNDIVTNEATGEGYLMYTGEVLTPSYIFFKNGKQVEVPEGSYTISRYDGDEGGRDAELKDVDTYTAFFKTAEDVKNYDFDSCTATVKVTKDRVFNDVANDFWAAQDIYTANKKGWMNGYGGTKFFGPNDDIKRGDVAVVLYKMAGRPEIVDEGRYNENTGYDTGFGDVDGKKYYAEAILWAKDAGIVSGDTGTGMFRPEDSISRQELAKMLSVYAEKCGEDVSTDVDAVLGEYEDAGTVSEWAEGYVAYLVSEGIMGNESPLRGTDPITRAEVATMVVRLSEVFDFGLIAR